MLLRTNTGASEDAANPAQLEASLQITRSAFFKASCVWDITPNENFCEVQCLVQWRTSRMSWNKISPQLKSTRVWTRSVTAEVTVAAQGGRRMTLRGQTTAPIAQSEKERTGGNNLAHKDFAPPCYACMVPLCPCGINSYFSFKVQNHPSRTHPHHEVNKESSR